MTGRDLLDMSWTNVQENLRWRGITQKIISGDGLEHEDMVELQKAANKHKAKVQ